MPRLPMPALGCGITRGGEDTVAPAGCDDWPDAIPRSVRSVRETFGRVEFAVIQTGPWDVADRRLEGDDRWRAPGDPVYDDAVASEPNPLAPPPMPPGTTTTAAD